jgi:hypothetical protein
MSSGSDLDRAEIRDSSNIVPFALNFDIQGHCWLDGSPFKYLGDTRENEVEPNNADMGSDSVRPFNSKGSFKGSTRVRCWVKCFD